jgi:hypothetical protein
LDNFFIPFLGSPCILLSINSIFSKYFLCYIFFILYTCLYWIILRSFSLAFLTFLFRLMPL